jgi:hypothetical protein
MTTYFEALAKAKASAEAQCSSLGCPGATFGPDKCKWDYDFEMMESETIKHNTTWVIATVTVPAKCPPKPCDPPYIPIPPIPPMPPSGPGRTVAEKLHKLAHELGKKAAESAPKPPPRPPTGIRPPRIPARTGGMLFNILLWWVEKVEEHIHPPIRPDVPGQALRLSPPSEDVPALEKRGRIQSLDNQHVFV